MAAYVIVDVDVKDSADYDTYRPLSGASVEQYGGRFLARGGRVEGVEGEWQPSRLVIIEFATMEQARTWYESPEYTAARSIRHRAADSQLIMVEGVG